MFAKCWIYFALGESLKYCYKNTCLISNNPSYSKHDFDWYGAASLKSILLIFM